MDDAIWELAEQCWQKEAQKRPIATALSDFIKTVMSACSVNTTQLKSTQPLHSGHSAYLPPSPRPPSVKITQQTPSQPLRAVNSAHLSPPLPHPLIKTSVSETYLPVSAEQTVSPQPLCQNALDVVDARNVAATLNFVVRNRSIIPSQPSSYSHPLLHQHADGMAPSSGESPVLTMKGHTGIISCIAFSPDGKRIISGSADQTIRMWDVQNGMAVSKPLLGHDKPVTAVAFSPNGRWLASSSSNTSI